MIDLKVNKKTPIHIFKDYILIGSIFVVFVGSIVYLALFSNMNISEKVGVASHLEKAIKLIIAMFVGGLIGIERAHRDRPAGLRTHALVCIGSCMTMIVSLDIFEAYSGVANVDPARLGAQVISGVGFLGAGTIIQNGTSVKGLTTAASLWVVACIGLGIGSGSYILSLSAAVIVYFTLYVVGNLERRHSLKGSNMTMDIVTRDEKGQIGKIGCLLENFKVRIVRIGLDRDEEENLVVQVTISIPQDLDIEEVVQQLKNIEHIINVNISS